jgi:hypothetical protein
LVDALGPDVARREIDTQSGNLTLECTGFNHRNLYPRQTPWNLEKAEPDDGGNQSAIGNGA